MKMIWKPQKEATRSLSELYREKGDYTRALETYQAICSCGRYALRQEGGRDHPGSEVQPGDHLKAKQDQQPGERQAIVTKPL